MIKKDILILGPSPFNSDINHAGGQLSAMTNLINYIDSIGIKYDIIDTFRSNFPPLSTIDKFKDSYNQYRGLKKLLENNHYKGALIFSSFGLGYWEKLFFALIIEKYNIKSLFFIRSGHFMDLVQKQNYRVPLKRYLMNRVSYIGYQGGNWEEFYIKLGVDRDRLVKILNWIEIIDYKRDFDREKVTFLYVGWIVKKKGVNELLETILENRDLDRFEFIFIGGGDLFDEFIDKTRDIDNIKFLGWLDRDIVEEYYRKADVLVLPSYAEGFPNVILEALNYRLPIIATNVGAISESVIDNYNGFLIEPKDKRELYNSILKLGNSRELREKFSKNSENILVKNHSIDRNCRVILDLFGIE